MKLRVIIVTTYRCPFCQRTYDTMVEAERCLALGFAPVFKVGDIVVPRAATDKKPYCRFGWYDGDSRWVYKDSPTTGLHGGRGIDFYYVVSHVEARPEGHQAVYHLFTAAMTGRQGHVSGYTTQESHIEMVLAKDPPDFVIKDSKRFLSKKSAVLL